MKKIYNIGELVAKGKQKQVKTTENEKCALSIVTARTKTNLQILLFSVVPNEWKQKQELFQCPYKNFLYTLLGDYILEKTRKNEQNRASIKTKPPKYQQHNPCLINSWKKGNRNWCAKFWTT